MIGPVEYYSSNWLFHLKVTIFIVMALLWIHPTRFFSKNRRASFRFATGEASVAEIRNAAIEV